jgi:hypothetical protein
LTTHTLKSYANMEKKNIYTKGDGRDDGAWELQLIRASGTS